MIRGTSLPMKILVGILYCIENELEECIASVNQQTHQGFDYFVLENLPKREAHHQLYAKFSAGAQDYDIFVKLDADMVLSRDTFFEEVVCEFTNDPQLTLLQVAVHDFFTDRLIFGQHNYRNTVRWSPRDDALFTDKQTHSGKRVNDSKRLAPAAFHCPNPSPFQAFHFGVHKAVKVMQNGVAHKRANPRNIHWNNLVRTRAHFDRTQDIRLGYAVLGAEIAFKHQFNYQQADYDDAMLQLHFKKVASLPLPEVKQAIRENTIFKKLPSPLRLVFISLRSEQKPIVQISPTIYFEVIKNMVKQVLEEDKNAVK